MTHEDRATMRRSTPVLGREVVIAPVPPARRATAALLAAGAMQDNPMHVAALGPDLSRRVEVMNRAFGVLLAPAHRHVLGAWHGDRLVGIAASTSSRHCQPDRGQWLRFPPTLLRAGSRAPRLLRWLSAWSRRDPATPHSHLGPVAVDPLVRGRGVGSRLLAEYVGGLDRDGESGYLETDRAENVRLYRRFGFEVVARADVLGVPNWFMVRRPAACPPRDGSVRTCWISLVTAEPPSRRSGSPTSGGPADTSREFWRVMRGMTLAFGHA